MWPDNQRARAGLDALGVRHLAWQLARGELSLAEATLDCLLPANRTVRAPRVAAARAAQATRDATAHAHDLNVAARDRLVAAAIVLVGVLSGGVVVETWFAVGGVDATELVYIGAMSSLVILGAMAATRRALTRSPVSMKVFTALAAMSFGSIVHRLFSWYTQTPVHTTLQVELVWFWCLLGIVGLFSEPGLLLSGLPFLAAAFGVALRPESAVEIFSAGMGASALISYAVMHRRARGAGAAASGDGTGR